MQTTHTRMSHGIVTAASQDKMLGVLEHLLTLVSCTCALLKQSGEPILEPSATCSWT